MKIRKIAMLILSAIAFSASAQNVITVTGTVQKTQYENASYLVNGSLSLEPGFTFNSTNGVFVASTAILPGTDRNYVREETIAKSGITTESQVIGLALPDKITTYNYLDGLGRSLQKVGMQLSPNGDDMVSFSFYDQLGRMSRIYLPYTSSSVNGDYKPRYKSEQSLFYSNFSDKISDDTRPFIEATFDASPLERVTKTITVGSDWYSNNKAKNVSLKIYDPTAYTPVRAWSISGAGLPLSLSSYPAGTLTVDEVADEEGGTTRIFSDFMGRQILKESLVSGSTWIRTYYVYDVSGNVAYVIPPQASGTFTPNQAFVDTWCFQSKYDQYQRQIGTKSPGADWTYYVYDQWDRLVLSQDGRQRNITPTAQWTFIKYDEFNRPITTGIYLSGSNQTTLASQVGISSGRFETRNTTAVGYSLNLTFPATAIENDLLVISYYDDYSYLLYTGWDVENNSYSFMSETGYTGTVNNAVKGLLTGNKIKILNGSTWLNNVNYYDINYRLIQSISEHQLGGVQRLTKEYDFAGKILKSVLTHNAPTQTVKLQQRNNYDLAGRLIRQYHQVNSQPEVILKSLDYNEIGQVVDKKLYSSDNGTTYLQKLDYRYNINGSLNNINYSAPEANDPPCDYFGEQLAFNSGFGSSSTARYDGQLGSLKWKDDLSGKESAYNYTYADRLDQLGSTAHQKYETTLPTTVDWSWKSRDYYTESESYDPNGNITSLSRNGRSELTAVQIDQLGYTYTGNQLTSVADGAPATIMKPLGFNDRNSSGADYTWDGAGSVASDLNKGIASLTYNILGLPDRVTFTSGSYIQYTYDATGNKLSQALYNNLNQLQNKSSYVGGFLYMSDVKQTDTPQMIRYHNGRLLPPTYANLISNTATRDANTQSGFTAVGSVSFTNQQTGGETYVVATAGQSGTPGVAIGGSYAVKPGESYTFNVLGYQSTGSTATLIVTDINNNIIPSTAAILPVGFANADWAKSTFIIPASVTQIKISVKWTNSTSGDAMSINKVALYKTDFEYQFFLTDHLGSPRVVLQTAPNTYTLACTMETENYNAEKDQFLNLTNQNETIQIAGNVTPGGNEAYLLNSLTPIGPAKSLKVFPGDKIDANVSGYYSSGSFAKNTLPNMATALAAVMGNGSQATVDGINNAYSYSATGSSLFTLSSDQGSLKPAAFINYILFDDSYVPLEAKSFAIGGAGLSLLTVPTITVKEKGLLFVYLSYDDQSGNSVYFDDFNITVTESPVVQVNAYYSYGLPAYSWLRDGETDNKFLFQGKELDPNAGWQDFGSRMYYADLGRWFSADPASQFSSPYIGMGNMPAIGNDPDGRYLWVDDAIFSIVGAWSNTINNWDKIHTPGDFIRYHTVGALGGWLTDYAGPYAGGLVAGSLNVLADNYNSDPEDRVHGWSWRSFATGAMSAFEADGVGGEALEEAGFEQGESIWADTYFGDMSDWMEEKIPKGFRNAFETGRDAVISNYADSKPNDHYSWGNVAVDFTIGAVASGIGDQMGEVDDEFMHGNLNKIVNYAAVGFSKGFMEAMLSNVVHTITAPPDDFDSQEFLKDVFKDASEEALWSGLGHSTEGPTKKAFGVNYFNLQAN
jgi:RHS repeat-associated protein